MRVRRVVAAGLAAALALLSLPGAASSAVAAPVDSGAGQPLILLVDVSSSMDQDGGNGLSKLDGAKAGMRDAISGRSGNLVGLWTYPTDGNCSPGGYVTDAEPVKRSDSAKLKAIVSNLAANGNTPTSQALEALGANLTKRGFQQANIVLVSDGESNCDPPKPPCDVARGLVAQGFDITINTIGFNISDAGREELTCIADATHGSYVSVEDSESLIDELQNQVNPTLRLSAASSPEPAAAGQPVELTVTVANTSSQQDVQDVTLSLAFRAQSSSDVMLSVVPPRVKLGSLPAGQSAAKTWQFSLEGLASGNKRAAYRAVAYGRLTDGTFVDGAITIDTSQVDEVGPNDWGVNIDGDDQIVIMGDSYSSGQGAWTYERWSDHGTDDPVNGCHTSQLTYGKNNPKKIMNLACSGAVMNNFTAVQVDSGSHTSAEPQFRKLARLSTAPRIVFMTIGGNDIGFADIISDCLEWKSFLAVIPTELSARCDQGDQSSLAKARQKLQRIQSGDVDPENATGRLAALYRQVWNEANSDDMRALRVRQGGAEFAPVVVLPYVSVAKTNNRPCNPVVDVLVDVKTDPLTAGDLRRLNVLQEELNEAIESEVSVASEGGKHGVFFAQGVATALDGHTACDRDPMINQVDRSWFTVKPEGMHPNAAGYERIGTRLRLFLASEDFTFTGKGPYRVDRQLNYCPEVVFLGDKEIIDKLPRLELGPGSEGAVKDMRLASCDYGVVYIKGMLPGSKADISIHSSPITLATLTANADGIAEGVFRVPGGLPSGQHTLVVEGLGADAKPFSYATPVAVSAPMPWYVWASGAAGLGALLAGVILLVIARRRKDRPADDQ